MKFGITLLLYFIFLVSNSQETRRYTEITYQINPFETKTYTEKFKNGNIKKSRTLTIYKLNCKSYSYYSGEYIEYSKDGKKVFERIHNMFGSPLFIKWYDKNENLIGFSKTIDLDTKAKSIEQFLSSDRMVSIIDEYEKYVFDPIEKILKLKKKGNYVNGIKSGIWEIYKNGEVIKTKDYGVKDKFENLSRDKKKK